MKGEREREGGREKQWKWSSHQRIIKHKDIRKSRREREREGGERIQESERREYIMHTKEKKEKFGAWEKKWEKEILEWRRKSRTNETQNASHLGSWENKNKWNGKCGSKTIQSMSNGRFVCLFFLVFIYCMNAPFNHVLKKWERRTKRKTETVCMTRAWCCLLLN